MPLYFWRAALPCGDSVGHRGQPGTPYQCASRMPNWHRITCCTPLARRLPTLETCPASSSGRSCCSCSACGVLAGTCTPRPPPSPSTSGAASTGPPSATSSEPTLQSSSVAPNIGLWQRCPERGRVLAGMAAAAAAAASGPGVAAWSGSGNTWGWTSGLAAGLSQTAPATGAGQPRRS